MAQSFFLKNGAKLGPLADLDGPVDGGIGTVDRFYGNRKLDPFQVFFPEQLLEIDHWITFRAFETKQLNRSTSSEKLPVGYITLPIPGNLVTAYNINYDESSLGAVGQTIVDALGGGPEAAVARELAEKMAPSAVVGATVAKIFGGNILSGMTTAAIAGGLTTEQGRAITASAVIDGLGTLGAAGIAQFGIARNPHKVVLFESVGFRKHTFSYQFVPQSFIEAEKLRQIITYFKLFASPSLNVNKNIDFGETGTSIGLSNITLSGGKHFFKYPEYFEIDFHHPRFLFSIGPSVLESVEVNYQPGGMPTYSRETGQKDPTPTGINISLSFKETEIVTKENILSENR